MYVYDIHCFLPRRKKHAADMLEHELFALTGSNAKEIRIIHTFWHISFLL